MGSCDEFGVMTFHHFSLQVNFALLFTSYFWMSRVQWAVAIPGMIACENFFPPSMNCPSVFCNIS